MLALEEILQAVHKWYLKFIFAIDTSDIGLHNRQHLTETHQENNHCYKGFSLLSETGRTIQPAMRDLLQALSMAL